MKCPQPAGKESEIREQEREVRERRKRRNSYQDVQLLEVKDGLSPMSKETVAEKEEEGKGDRGRMEEEERKEKRQWNAKKNKKDKDTKGLRHPLSSEPFTDLPARFDESNDELPGLTSGSVLAPALVPLGPTSSTTAPSSKSGSFYL